MSTAPREPLGSDEFEEPKPSESTPSSPESAALDAAETTWRREVLDPALAKQGERQESFVTQQMHWPVKDLYTPKDLEEIGFDYHEDVGFPGQYPYTRGTTPAGYRQDLWKMLQVTGFGTANDSAERWSKMLEQGLNGFIIEYDLPTTNGYDSDHPLAEGEVARAGTAIDTLADMEQALDLPWDKLQHLNSVCNAPQPVNLAMILAALEKRGIEPSSFTLQMSNAILIEYTCVGRYIYPPKHGLRIATDCIEYTIRNHPNWIPITVVSAQLYAARANPVQELAFGFSIAMEYLDATLARGFDIDEVAPYWSFVTGLEMDFFEAVSKLRAYRKIWARLMKERYGAKRHESMQLKLISSPGTTGLTLQQPLNNIARLGIQTLACALGGGAYAITTPLHDEAHALPSEEAVRVGIAVQNIVAHETGVADTVDPLAGSYLVESMTRKMEDEVFAEIERVDAMGGALAAIEAGYFQKELARSQRDRHREIEDGARKQIGVNHLVQDGEKRTIEMFKLGQQAEELQVEQLVRVRAERDEDLVAKTLERVREAAIGDENLVPPIMEAVKAYATQGEICDVMRDVFGVYHPDSLTSGV
ncbi:methylmalonyl-CoA mutase family protein [Myxococcota bacterium]|nr:methylmalonyl-CoA mutase family protein [Myxococcota bacterium]